MLRADTARLRRPLRHLVNRANVPKLAAVLAVVLLLGVAHYSGILRDFAEPVRAARSLGALGAVWLFRRRAQRA